MPKKVEKLLKFENLDEIKKKIIEILQYYKGFASNFNEIQFNLLKERGLNIDLGSKFFIYDILKDLIREGKIQSIISNGTEYFYLE